MQSIAKVGSPFLYWPNFCRNFNTSLSFWPISSGISQTRQIQYLSHKKTSEEIYIPQSFTFLSKAFYKRLATDVMQGPTILLRYNLTSHIERLKRFIHLGHSLKTSGIQSPWSDWHYVSSRQSRTLYLCTTQSGIWKAGLKYFFLLVLQIWMGHYNNVRLKCNHHWGRLINWHPQF